MKPNFSPICVVPYLLAILGSTKNSDIDVSLVITPGSKIKGIANSVKIDEPLKDLVPSDSKSES